MKKILLALVAVVIIVSLLPILGNTLAQQVLKDRIAILTLNGVEVKDEITEANYLNTKKHYEFSVLDAPKFIEYLNQYADAQIPPYVDAMLGGVVVGVDIEYSNFPFSSKVLLDIYPLSLSTTMMDELKKEDLNFHGFVKNLLENKGILYHINYYITDKMFDGYIKNMDEGYTFDNGTKVNFKIFDATYYGQGSLLAPQNLQTNIKNITFKVNAPENDIFFKMNDMASASTFESHSTYASSGTIKTFSILINETKSGKTEVNIDNIKLNISSNTQGKKAEFYAKSSLGVLKINSKVSNFVATGFNYDLSLDGVDKDSYEEFRKLTAHTNANYSTVSAQELKEVVTKVLSKGLSLSIADLSVDKIGIENKKVIDGFSVMAKIILKEDIDLAKKLKSSSVSLIENINLASTIKISKEFYSLLNKELPIASLAGGLAREDGNNLLFVIKLNNGQLNVNDKVLN